MGKSQKEGREGMAAQEIRDEAVAQYVDNNSLAFHQKVQGLSKGLRRAYLARCKAEWLVRLLSYPL